MIDETLLEAEEKMNRAIEVAKQDFMAIRTGRATPAMFNKITVDYYGTPTPLQQMASFQTPEARLIVISPFDKGQLHAIEKSIRDSDLGVNPGNESGTCFCRDYICQNGLVVLDYAQALCSDICETDCD